MFKHYTMRLVHELCSPKHPVNVFDGSMSSMEPLGVNYALIPKQKGAKGANEWFPATLAGQRQALLSIRARQPPPDYSMVDAGLFFHWPTFLRGAALGGFSQLRPMALEMLTYTRPLILQYDPILADDLDHVTALLRKNSFPEDADVRRFDAHLNALLLNRSFLRYFTDSMEISWSAFRQIHLERSITGCVVQAHRKGQKCDACEGSYWTREHSTLLMLRRYNVPELRRGVTLQLRSPEWFQESTDPWVNEVLYWQGGSGGEDGIAHFSFAKKYGNQILINYQKILETALRIGRPTPLLKFVDPGLSSDTWGAGYKARLAFDTWSSGRYHPSDRPITLQQMVEKAGWEWRDVVEHPYGVYLQTALQGTLARSTEMRVRLSRRVRSVRKEPPRPRNRRSVVLSYGEAPVQVIRRTLRSGETVNYYTPPFEVDVRTMRPEERRRVAIRWGNTYFISAQGFNRLANMATKNDEPVYPEARAFVEWLIVQDGALTKEKFRKLEYEARYGERVAKKLGGMTKHIGQFTEAETEIVRQFFSNRSRGRVTAFEWDTLLSQLPTRTKPSIRLQVEKLGKEFALAHGYTHYANSGLCLNRSEKRRKQWIKEGVCP